MQKPGRWTLTRKLFLGRFGIPVWTLGLAMVLTAAAAGQAVGPVLTGSTSGSVNLVVEQAITLDTDGTLGANPATSDGDDAVTTRNDEGTAFTVAMELNVGQRVYACLYLQNDSGADASAILDLNVPAGIDVEVEEFSEGDGTAEDCDSAMDDDGLTSEAQLNRNTWLLVIDDTAGAGGTAATANDGVRITIEPKDDLKPGFYTITGQFIQVSG